MDEIFDKFFQYGYHDTEFTSIDCKGLKVIITFGNGVYLLDENGKETILSNPINLVLEINPSYHSAENAFEIREYDKKIQYIDFWTLKNYLKKENFGIAMNYYSNFNKSILFDGGFVNKLILLSIEGIESISVTELK